MIFRIAKLKDKSSLARLHLEAGRIQPDGFMHQLGFYFLKSYYDILLREKNSVVILAEDLDGVIHGFCSGTSSAEDHLIELKRNKIILITAAIPALLMSPKLMFKILSRYRFVAGEKNSIEYGVSAGARSEYWAWRPQSKNLEMSVKMFNQWKKIMFDLGCNSIKGEVDLKNKYILKLHRLLGAVVVAKLTLADGRERVIIEYLKK